MGCIWCLCGKSATGKDTVYRKVMEQLSGQLEPVVIYTTRPIREGEVDGKTYHFATVDFFHAHENDPRMIESRVYHTRLGDWFYFTMDDGSLDVARQDYFMITTLEGFEKLHRYFGPDKVKMVYIEVDDCERLRRALNRESAQAHPRVDEVCRRYLADEADFSPEKLSAMPMELRVENDDADRAAAVIAAFIRENASCKTSPSVV